jgi:hypothetical protein
MREQDHAYKYTLQRTDAENWKQIFPEKELRVHSPTSPLSTVMCLWVIYIFPQSVCLLCCRTYVDRSWKYINHSQIHECGNLDWGRAFPRKGIHTWDFPCSADRKQVTVKESHIWQINVLESANLFKCRLIMYSMCLYRRIRKQRTQSKTR